MLRLIWVLAVVSIGAQLSSAQTEEHRSVPLWPAAAPGAKGNSAEDIPTLTLFPVPGAQHPSAAVIVFPGGGYRELEMGYEGEEEALWLNKLGVAGFVVKYRLGPKYHYPVELWDGQRAVRYVRAHAREFNVKPNQIGVWGFSAGGHLASTVGTHFDKGDPNGADAIDRQSSRPDFMILAYPVITLEAPYVHLGSLHNLLGEKPDPNLVRLLSNESQVTPDTPPTFLFHTTEDQVVPVENSVFFYLALRKAGVPVEMHLYQRGKHGAGLGQKDPILRSWPDRLADWLKLQGLR